MFQDYKEDGPVLLTGTDNKIHGSFLLTGVGTTVANTLRRAILMETRTVGFHADLTNTANPGIRITKNTGPIFNEMLAHRLTLIPIGVRNFASFDPSKYEFALKVSNTSAVAVDVTADMFQVREKGDDGIFHPVDPVVTAAMFPRDPITGSTCLITTLRPHWNPDLPPDEIDLVATAVYGTGRDFMGFCPVAQAAFHNTLDEDPVRQDSFFKTWLADFKKVTDSTTVDPAVLAAYKAEWSTMAIQRCFQVDSQGEPNSFTFNVESVGIRPVREIVEEAIKAVITLVSKYTDPVSFEGVSFTPLDSRMSGIQVAFVGQEHTLGCLLEAMVHDLYLTTEGDAPVTYVAYKVPHPLQKKMVLILGKHVTGHDDVTEDVATQVVVAAAKKAKTVFEGLLEAWISGTPTRAP
jgi:DNA-directed RNA polymerase subunit L